jgi:hypothetical protein
MEGGAVVVATATADDVVAVVVIDESEDRSSSYRFHHHLLLGEMVTRWTIAMVMVHGWWNHPVRIWNVEKRNLSSQKINNTTTNHNDDRM